jgi:peptidoglycan/LPS O-acetylase OafA/YrhL
MTSATPAARDERGSTAADTRVPELDGVRGLAILFILIWHYVGIPSGIGAEPDRWIPSFHHLLIFFKSGVDLFFTLSGFLIVGILLDQRATPNYYRTFFIRRACRIFPLYYLLVIAYIIAKAAGATHPLFQGSIPIASYLTMTQNYTMAHFASYGAIWLGATWSLAIEEQFYLIFPFIVRHCANVLPWILGAGIIGAELLRVWCYLHYGNDWAAYTWLPCRIDALCAGALLACAFRSPAAREQLNRHRRLVTIAFVALLGGAAALACVLPRNIGFHMTVWGHSLLAAAFAVSILLVLLHRDQPATRFLRWSPLRYLGRISYGVYLMHAIALVAVFHWANRGIALDSISGVGLSAAALAMTIAFCALSLRWFEQPLLRLGHRAKYASA